MSVLAKIIGLCTAAMLFMTTQAQAQDYRIQSGDVLRIEVLEDTSLNRTALVTPDGRVGLPLAGTVIAAGRTVSQVQAALASRLAVNFASAPTVFVGVERINEAVLSGPAAPATVDVFLVGEANKPGRLTVEHGTTLLQLFGEMGGFTKFAATKRVQLRRMDGQTGKETVYTFNYRDIVNGASSGGTTHLRDGDVILIPQRKLFE